MSAQDFVHLSPESSVFWEILQSPMGHLLTLSLYNTLHMKKPALSEKKIVTLRYMVVLKQGRLCAPFLPWNVALSGDIFGYHNWGRCKLCCWDLGAVARDVAKHPTVHRTVSPTPNKELFCSKCQ